MRKNSAIDYFDDIFNCAEAVLLYIKDEFGIKCGDIPKMATPFGAGVGKTGRICGALAGGIIAIGYLFGRSVDGLGEKDIAYDLSGRLADAFEDEFGSVDCWDISEIDWSKEEDLRRYREEVHYEICHNVVRFVSDYLKEEIEKIER
jgi:C_GCAxxG_C_C family probable redox protein